MVTATVALAATAVVLVVVTGIGVWYTRGGQTAEAYITARDSAGRGQTTATLIASVMGVWILLAPVEAGAAFGGIAAVAGYAVGEALPMVAYARLGPRIRALLPAGHSLTEYALARYGAGMYGFVLVVSVFYMFIFLAAELTGIATALELIAGVPRWQSATLIAGFVLAYTAYGGLRASLVTDTVQTLVLLPTLLAVAVGAVIALGGTAAIHEAVVAADPSLLDPTFFTGLRFGFWVAIAILGAELLNQSWWQRIYAARDAETVRRGFTVAAVANAAVVFLAGLFGVLARGRLDLTVDPTSEAYDASVAFFLLANDAFPEWIAVCVVLVAVVLVTSSADTMFNALASLVTADLSRLLADPSDRTLRVAARSLTVVVALAAVLVSLRARSVLGLFLLADLLGAAVMVPLFAGLYAERVGGGGALAGGVAGIAFGVAYFPNRLVRGTLEAAGLGSLLPTPDFLVAFVGAVAASTVVTGALVPFGGRFDLRRLDGAVRRLDDSGGEES
ncbi:MAG: sodium:proline symporter [Halobaculum sp.]